MDGQAIRRRRPAKSCVECRRRKIRCNREDPCNHCASGKSRCTYKLFRNESLNDQRSSSSSSPQLRQFPVERTQQIRSQDNNLTPSDYPLGTQTITASSGTDHAVITSTNLNRGDSRTISGLRIAHTNGPANSGINEDIFQRLQNFEQFSTTGSDHGQPATPRDLVAQQVGLQASQLILMKSRVIRWSHLMFMAKEFADIFACMRNAGLKENEKEADDGDSLLFKEIRDLFQKCKSLARMIKSARPNREISYSLELSPPSREVADLMVDSYFAFFESTYRILHEPSFRMEYQRYWEQPENVTTASQLTILLVIGIGSSLHDHSELPADFRGNVQQWTYAAQRWLSGPLEKGCLDVAGLQIYCLTLMAREVVAVGGDLLWVSMGSLVHRAMQIGLHRDPNHLPPMSLLQAEIRRRLWATVLEMVAQSSLDSGLPARISLEESDTEAPSNLNDNEIDGSTTTLPVHPIEAFTTTSMQLLLLRSIPVRLRILQLLNGLRSKLFYPDVLALDSELIESYRDCNNFLKENGNTGVSRFHRNILDYMLRRFLLPLHCPFARTAGTNPLFYYSRKASLDTAMAIGTYEHDKRFLRLLTGGGGMFREGVLCAATTISIELIAHIESQRLDGTIPGTLSSREPIKQALYDMISLAAERIKQGETNIKMHLFLSMALAQAQAIEAGACSEIEIAQSAKSSLELCHGLLSSQVEVLPFDLGDHLPLNFDGQDDWDKDFNFGSFFPDVFSFGS